MNMRIVFRIRPFYYLFVKNWYGKRKQRWNYTMYYLIDFGMITFGYSKKL